MSAKICLFPLIAASMLAMAGCESDVAGPGGNGGAPMNAAELAKADDQEAQELLQDKAHIAEAKDWLSPLHKDHSPWKVDRQAVVQLVNDLYDAGATKVWAADIDEKDKLQIVTLFIVELPSDKDKRAKVLEIHNTFWKKLGDSGEDVAEVLLAEHGQKYILLDFDQ